MHPFHSSKYGGFDKSTYATKRVGQYASFFEQIGTIFLCNMNHVMLI